MRLQHVEVAISTLGNRITAALRLAERLTELFDVLVIHQMPDGEDHGAAQLLATLTHKPIRYIACHEAGLSRSRNIALREARREYLWLLDDDVDVDLEACRRFFGTALPPAADVVTVAATKAASSKGSRYPRTARRHNALSILSVGSIEMILKPDRIRASGCRFPEDMGAGTDLPVGEEPVFLACCLRRGLTLSYYPAYLVSHPHESSGDRFLESAHCRARGVVFARIYGPVAGLLLLCALYARHAPGSLSREGLRRFLAGIRESVRGLHATNSD